MIAIFPNPSVGYLSACSFMKTHGLFPYYLKTLNNIYEFTSIYMINFSEAENV